MSTWKGSEQHHPPPEEGSRHCAKARNARESQQPVLYMAPSVRLSRLSPGSGTIIRKRREDADE